MLSVLQEKCVRKLQGGSCSLVQEVVVKEQGLRKNSSDGSESAHFQILNPDISDPAILHFLPEKMQLPSHQNILDSNVFPGAGLES